MNHHMRFLLMLSAAALLALAGCKKDGDDASGAATDDDIADAVAATLGGSQSTFGVAAQAEQAARVVGTGSIHKSASPLDTLFMEIDTTISRSGPYSFSYTFHYEWMIPNPNRVEFYYSMRGTYTTPRITSNDSAQASWAVTNILTGPAYRVDGVYDRSGSQQSRQRSLNRFSSRIILTATALLVSKQSRLITEGTCAFSVTGRGGDGATYTRTGTVTFSGNQTATLTFTGGKAYTVDLALGEASAK
jgi:hypothetical protein